jgi:integrase/recombinase XerD
MKDRIIYTPEQFSRQLLDWLKIQNKNPLYVFCDKSGKPLTGNSIACLLKRIEKRVGFKVHPHLLRHTYASICVKRGINLHTLQQQM